MKKIIKMSTFIFTILFVFPIFVFANENYYINKNGVSMSEEEYEVLLNFFTQDKIDSMSESEINLYKDYSLISEEKEYKKVMIYYDESGNVSGISEQNVTEDEYKNPISFLASCPTTSTTVACWETNYKEITLSVWGPENHPSNNYMIVFINNWKTVPSIRSYDLIGVSYTNFSLVEAWGDQTAYNTDGNYGSTTVEYSFNGTNMKVFDNGVGISQNLIDSAEGYGEGSLNITNRIVLMGQPTSTNVEVRGSYQHSTSDISLATSKQYNIFNTGIGMGGVFVFYNSTVSGYYDRTQGLYYNWVI